MPGQVLHDGAGGDDPDAGTDAEDGGQQTDGHPDLLPGELVADDADGQRQDRARRALQDPGDDQDAEAGGERREEGADGPAPPALR
ncbi:hypothetical protein GCM10009818_32430 [Nakamurella flavida]